MKRKALKSIGCLCTVILITGMIVLSGSVGESLAKEPIKIGFIGALSTPYGASNKASLDISVEEINKAGGILGRPVELITEDWKREVPLAVAAYKKLVLKDKCLVIFTEGTEGSTACAQLGERLYSSQPHLLFAFWTAHEGFTDLVANEYNKYKFIFRVYPSTADTYNPNLQFVDFFKKTIGTKKLALLIEDIGWTEVYRKGKPGVFPTQREYFEKNGIKVVYETNTDIKEKMFLPILEKVAASGADTIYWITGYTDTVTLVKQWAQSPAKNMDLVFQSGAVSYAAFWKMTGGQALGVTATWPEIMIPFSKMSKPFLDKLKAKGGENIYAKEVEDVLVTHPAVAQAVVIGVPDDKWGESVKALIVKRKDVDTTEEEIINFCKDRLSSFKKPKSVEFVEDFPKSTAGKILKRELRQKYWEGRDRKI